jgi:hypothetical protein
LASDIEAMGSPKRNRKQGELEIFYADKIVRAFAPTAIRITLGNADWHQPDVLYGFGKRLIGIEITGAYYSDKHAQTVWTVARPSARTQASVYKFSFKEPDKLIRESVQKRILEKSKKKYQKVDEVWLGIHQEADLSDKGSTDLALKQIWLPKSHPFARMFLVHRLPWHDGGGYRVIQFFPSVEAYWFNPRSQLVEAIFALKSLEKRLPDK